MARFCQIVNERVTYQYCQECEDKICNSAKRETKPLPKDAKQRIPEEYRVGDIVYGRNGQKYKLLSVGYKGYDAYVEYLDGPMKGQTNYFAEVNWLYKE